MSNCSSADVTPKKSDNPITEIKDNSIASKTMAYSFLSTFAPAITMAITGIGAADEVLKKIQPIINSIFDLRVKLDKLTHLPDLNAKSKQYKEAIEIAVNQLTEHFKKINKNAKSDEIAINLRQYLLDIEKIEAVDQVGGKKIISRTHKSINQFLNPKITAANMQRSKKRFLNTNTKTKTKYKYKSKKRNLY
jgi:hypothetical protein